MSEHYNLPAASLFFKGRPGDPRLGELVIPLKDAAKISRFKSSPAPCVILGCPDDLGVTLNRGRAGAAGGPDAIRKFLYKMTPPMDATWPLEWQLYDFGNVRTGKNILETHDRARAGVKKLISQGATVVSLGGGHDFAAPSFLGLVDAYRKKNKTVFGLINVDPHLDVRPLEDGLPHSGTPFRQILDSGTLKGENFVEFGTHVNRNAADHFNFCRNANVQIKTLTSLRAKSARVDAHYARTLKKISSMTDVMGATFDMDACAECEGVSAPPVLGFTASEMVAMAAEAGKQQKVRWFEIAEVAPSLEPTERSARIGAEMVYAFLNTRAQQ